MNTFNKTLSRVTLVLGVTFMSAFQLYADDWKEIMYADPTIFVENGKYYLTGTRNQEPQGFAILESTDLEHWTVPDPPAHRYHYEKILLSPKRPPRFRAPLLHLLSPVERSHGLKVFFPRCC